MQGFRRVGSGGQVRRVGVRVSRVQERGEGQGNREDQSREESRGEGEGPGWDRFIECKECCMWEDFSATGLTCTFEEAQEDSFEYTCGRCRRVETLGVQLAALKIELEEARDRIRAVEDRGEDVRPGEGEETRGDEIVEAEGVDRGDQGEEDTREVSPREGEADTVVKEREEVREAVVIGSSIVRKTDSVFCGADRAHRVRVCLPGAKIRDVEERLEAVVGSSGVRPRVIVQVGTNDLSDRSELGGRIGTEEVLDRYRELVGRLTQLDCDALVMGILPRYRMSGWEASRICAINRRLGGLCRQSGIAFRDVWEDFVGRREMFSWDGLHPSQRGGNRLGEVYSEWVQQQGN